MIFPKTKNARATWAPLRLADARHLPCGFKYLSQHTTQKFRTSLFKGLQGAGAAPLLGFGAKPQHYDRKVVIMRGKAAIIIPYIISVTEVWVVWMKKPPGTILS